MFHSFENQPNRPVVSFASPKETIKDTNGAEYHLCEAVKYFTEWGAHAKVEALQQKHPDMFLSGHLPEETL